MLQIFPANVVLSVLMSTNLVGFNLRNGEKPCILYPPYGGRGIEFLASKNGGKPSLVIAGAGAPRLLHLFDQAVAHLDVGEELALVSGHVRPVASR